METSNLIVFVSQRDTSARDHSQQSERIKLDPICTHQKCFCDEVVHRRELRSVASATSNVFLYEARTCEPTFLMISLSVNLICFRSCEIVVSKSLLVVKSEKAEQLRTNADKAIEGDAVLTPFDFYLYHHSNHQRWRLLSQKQEEQIQIKEKEKGKDRPQGWMAHLIHQSLLITLLQIGA